MLVKSIIRTKDQAQGVLPIIRGVARIFPEQRTIFQIPLPPPPPPTFSCFTHPAYDYLRAF